MTTIKRELKDEYKHLTVNELATKFNVNRKTIIKYFSKNREDYIKENALRRAEMYKLKCDGWTLSQIGKKYGTTRHNVSLLIKKHKQQYANQLNLI